MQHISVLKEMGADFGGEHECLYRMGSEMGSMRTIARRCVSVANRPGKGLRAEQISRRVKGSEVDSNRGLGFLDSSDQL